MSETDKRAELGARLIAAVDAEAERSGRTRQEVLAEAIGELIKRQTKRSPQAVTEER